MPITANTDYDQNSERVDELVVSNGLEIKQESVDGSLCENDENRERADGFSMSNGVEIKEKPVDEHLREQDIYLPIANVSRVMRKGIPQGVKTSNDAKLLVQECVSEFISFVTSEAAGRCNGEERKNLNGDDIIHAMSTLGFDNYVEPLKLFLQKYRSEVKLEK